MIMLKWSTESGEYSCCVKDTQTATEIYFALKKRYSEEYHESEIILECFFNGRHYDIFDKKYVDNSAETLNKVLI